MLFEVEENDNCIVTDAPVETKISKTKMKLLTVFPEIKKNTTVHFVSKGEWSMHDLILHILEIIGPSDIYAATWSVSNQAVTDILAARKKGLIRKMEFLVDWRVKVRRPDAYEYLKNHTTNMYLTNSHAKTAILINEKYQVSIVGSANFTNNPRIEAGVITESSEVANFHKRWIMDEIAGAKPFDEE